MGRATRLLLAGWCVLAVVGGALPSRAQGAAARVLIWDSVVAAEQDPPLRWPTAVAAAAADELGVAEAADATLRILRFEAGRWQLHDTVRLGGTPYALAHDGLRYAVSLRQGAGLYVVEGERHQLRKLGLPGGAVPGALAAVPGGGFLVFDVASGVVLKLDASGASAGRAAVTGRITALAAKPDGGFYAVLADRAEVRQHGADGAVVESWTVPGEGPTPAWPSGLVVEPGGDVIVVDRHVGRLLVFEPGGRWAGVGGRRGWDPGLLRFPAGAARFPDGGIVVADQGNGRVQLFLRSGTGASP